MPERHHLARLMTSFGFVFGSRLSGIPTCISYRMSLYSSIGFIFMFFLRRGRAKQEAKGRLSAGCCLFDTFQVSWTAYFCDIIVSEYEIKACRGRSWRKDATWILDESMTSIPYV